MFYFPKAGFIVNGVNDIGGHIFPKIYTDRDGTSGKSAVSVNYATGKWPTCIDDACSVNDTSGRQWQQYQIAYTLYWPAGNNKSLSK